MVISAITSNQTYAKASFYSMMATIGIGLGIFIKNQIKDNDNIYN